jgi:hypothetical protein
MSDLGGGVTQCASLTVQITVRYGTACLTVLPTCSWAVTYCALCLQAVARLTADNLVFMARLRAAEAAAAAAVAERDEYRLALEQHKGPWMDEVSLLALWPKGNRVCYSISVADSCTSCQSIELSCSAKGTKDSEWMGLALFSSRQHLRLLPVLRSYSALVYAAAA